MARSSLFGRRIHIAGSIPDDLSVAPVAEVEQARELVQGLVRELLKRGASFVVPVDAEKIRSVDRLPICFDWLVWQTLRANLTHRPGDAPNPLAIAVQHHKNEEQIPEQFERLWDDLRNSDLVQIENAAHWSMGVFRQLLFPQISRPESVRVHGPRYQGLLHGRHRLHVVANPVQPSVGRRQAEAAWRP